MSNATDRTSRQRLLRAGVIDQKPPKTAGAIKNRVGLPGFGDAPVSVQPKKAAAKRKLNTPTKHSTQPSTTPPPTGAAAAGAAAGARDAVDNRGKDTAAGAADDPYAFPDNDEDSDLVIDGQPSTAAAAANGVAASKGQGHAAAASTFRSGATALAGLSQNANRQQGSLPAGTRTFRGGINSQRTNVGASRQLFGDEEGDYKFSSRSNTGLLARHAMGSATAATGFATASTVGGACLGGSAVGGGTSCLLGRGTKQLGIRSFTVPQQQPFGSPTSFAGKLPAGMVNHGNTCYLNAVLQALLSLPCLARDVSSDSVQQLQLPQDGVTQALHMCLQQYNASCSGAGSERSGCAISPAVVSVAMARLSPRWGSCRQEDAHEFMTALLDAMQTEVLAAQHRQLTSSIAATANNGALPCGQQGAGAGQSAAAAMALQDDAAALQDAAEATTAVAAAAGAALPDQQCTHEEHGQQQQQQQGAAAAGSDGVPSAGDAAEAASGGTTAATALNAAAAASEQPAGPRLCVSLARCPASRNFTGCLQHTLTCSECGHVTCVKEQFNHLSLDLPPPPGASTANKGGSNSSAPGSPMADWENMRQDSVDWLLNDGLGGVAATTSATAAGSAAGGGSEQYVPDLQSLLANFFAPETLEKACEACGAASAQHSLAHAVRRLPRVLVVHLKRFQWQVLAGGGAICRKLSTRVQPDKVLQLGPVCCPGRPVPPLLAELMPAGLLQAAHAACTAPDSGCKQDAQQQQQPQEDAAGVSSSSLSGAKRSRSEGDVAAAAAATEALHEARCPGGSKQQKREQQAQPKQQTKQQELPAAWGLGGAAAGAAGAGPGFSRPNKGAQTSRFALMHQHQQHGQTVATVDGSMFSTMTAAGGRHTDFTKLQQQQQPPGNMSGRGADAAFNEDAPINSLPVTGECGLPRNNSSTDVPVVNLVLEDDDAELQKVLELSLETHEAELAARSGLPSPTAHQDQPGASDAPQKSTDLAAGAPQENTADDMPGWMAAGAGSPRTPKAPPRPAAKRPMTDKEIADLVWANLLGGIGAEADTGLQQQLSGNGGLSGGAGGGGVGLSGGLAFSDSRPAARPTGSVLQQADLRCADRTPPNSPPRRLQPLRGAVDAVAGLPDRCWAAESSKLLDGIECLSEEEQLKRAIAQSLLEQGGGGGGAPGAGGALVGMDKDGYDEEAALAAALAASAAEQEVLQHQGKPAGLVQLADKVAAEAAGQPCSEQGGGTSAAAASTDKQQGTSGSGGDGAAVVDDDDAVMMTVALEAAPGCDGTAAGEKQQPWPRLSLVRLVEDSDCEDDDEPAQPAAASPAAATATAAGGTGQQSHQAAAAAGDVNGPDPMEVDAQQQQPAAAGAQQQHGKENQEEQQRDSAAGSAAAAGKPKQRRRPLGEILCSREAAKANQGSCAAEPAAKQPTLAAAVAAAEAAAATGAAAGSSELEATDAAAAAAVAGAWPQENAAQYELRAVVRHKGPLASSGHFVSEVMSDQQGGQWFHYDDSYVQPTTLATVVRRCEADGYLFFYVNSAILGNRQQQQQQQHKKQL